MLNSTWWASRSDGEGKAWDKQGQIKTRTVGVNYQDEMTKISGWSMLGLEMKEVEVVVWALLAAAAMNRGESSTSVLVGATARWRRTSSQLAFMLFCRNGIDLSLNTGRYSPTQLTCPRFSSSLALPCPVDRSCLLSRFTDYYDIRLATSKTASCCCPLSFLLSFFPPLTCCCILSSLRLLCVLSLMGNPAFPCLPIRRSFSLFGARKCAARGFDMGE